MTFGDRVRQWVTLAPGPTDWIGGLRLACAFVLPIAVGVAVDRRMIGLFVGIGAFIVANADLGESYAQRARLMVPTTFAVAGLVALGMAVGQTRWLVVPVAAVILFGGAAFGAAGREAAIFGTFTSIAFVIGVGIAGAPGLSEVQVVVSLLAGGAVAMVLSAAHLLVVAPGPVEEPQPWSTLPARIRAGLTEVSSLRSALAITGAGVIALLVVPLTHQANGAWLVTGALMVLRSGFGDTVRLAVTRAAGTVFGAALAGAIAALTAAPAVLLVAALVLTWCAEAIVRRSFALFVVLITPLSILLTNVLVPGDWQVAFLRVADVAAGSALAIAMAAVLRLLMPDNRRDPVD